MPKGDKYLGLKKFLEKSGQPMIKLSFDGIEHIIHDRLPPSASEHSEAWWSNNKDHSQAVSWLDAGYETDYVTDTYKEKHIIFVKRD
jgi:hypothetical protein